VPDLVEVLAERLTATDLQSLLLEVFRRRASNLTSVNVLEQYVQNRFVTPSPVPPAVLLDFERLAFAAAAPEFEAIALSPLAPLGTCSAVGPVDPRLSIATIRNTEVVSDLTNVLALECALRRRSLVAKNPRAADRIRLCAHDHVVRPQAFGSAPGSFAHFALFGAVTAGRDEGSRRFEIETAVEHLTLYLRMLTTSGERGFTVAGLRVKLENLDMASDDLMHRVADAVRPHFAEVQWHLHPQRTSEGDYYQWLRFGVLARDADGNEHHLVDGGFTAWTQKLLSNNKERVCISGIGSQRVCLLFRSRL
jgi:hypothetical protein